MTTAQMFLAIQQLDPKIELRLSLKGTFYLHSNIELKDGSCLGSATCWDESADRMIERTFDMLKEATINKPIVLNASNKDLRRHVIWNDVIGWVNII